MRLRTVPRLPSSRAAKRALGTARSAMTAAAVLAMCGGVLVPASAASAHVQSATMHAKAMALSYTRVYTPYAATSDKVQCLSDGLQWTVGDDSSTIPGAEPGGKIVYIVCNPTNYPPPPLTGTAWILELVVEYGTPPENLGNTCTQQDSYPSSGGGEYPTCEGAWEAGTYNFAQLDTQSSTNHSLTNLTWVPYPGDTRWGWLEDPNGQAVAYDSSTGYAVMYTRQNVWWELWQDPSNTGFYDNPIAIDSNNNGTPGWCAHFWSDGSGVGFETNSSRCYGGAYYTNQWAGLG